MALTTPLDGNPWGTVVLDYAQDRALILYTASLVIIFAIGWVTALVVLGFGRYLHHPRAVALGSIGLGLMTIATPLGVYVSLVLQRGGILEATVFDLSMLSVLGFLGGIISTVAFLRIWSKASVNEPLPGGHGEKE